MRKNFVRVTILVILVNLLGSCTTYETNVDEDKMDDNQESNQESLVDTSQIISEEQEFLIEDYQNDTWDDKKYVIEAIRDIFISKERYYNHEFKYAVLTEELGDDFDLPKTFIKPDDVYGYLDLNDYSTAITNSDTATMSDIEFNELVQKITLYKYPSDLGLIDVGGPDTYDTIQSKERKYYVSSIIVEDENSSVIYVKELNTYNNAELVQLEFDTVITDYWFLFKNDIGKVYSHKKWDTDGYMAELDLNKIIIRDKTIDVEMYEITDSILK